MTNNQPESKGPEDAATSKGPNAKAVRAFAPVAGYTIALATDKKKGDGPSAVYRDHSAPAREGGRKAVADVRGANLPQAAFSDSAGRKWAYKGKRARVLAMLVQERDGGVTQWDTLPWHTRLGGTIHAMREDGLSITTEREGEYRHARYRLETPGRLLIHAENSQAPVILHRDNSEGTAHQRRGQP